MNKYNITYAIKKVSNGWVVSTIDYNPKAEAEETYFPTYIQALEAVHLNIGARIELEK